MTAGGRSPAIRNIVEHPCADVWLRNFASVVEQTADGICITDADGIIEYANPAFESITGYRREALIGQKTSLFRSGVYDDGFYRQLWGTLLAGRVYREVFVNRNARGEIIHVDETITPMTDAEGRVTHFIVAARDISARVRTEEALRRLDQSRDQQARWIAQTLHDEAGQYLTAAHISLAEAGRELGPAARERLQEARGHLDRVEEELRRLARELHPRVLDDLGLVDAVGSLAEGVRRRQGIEVSLEATLSGRLAPTVETTIYRLVQEALTNVRRHASASRVRILLTHEADAVRCEIEDNGVGFDPGAPSASAAAGGLGLRGMRDRVEALGGTLSIRSAPGDGTLLGITIPAEA